MGNDYFRFKQFTVTQTSTAMKVGVDSVLLGAWADTNHVRHILDIGCGTGLLALMLAQRISGANIDAVEIDEASCLQAQQNVANSPWKERIHVFCDDFRNFAGKCDVRYDLLISNPPFFIASLKSIDAKRNLARHNDCLSHSDLLSGAKKLLADKGLLAIVLPSVEARMLIDAAASFDLFPKRILHIQSFPSKPAHRMLIELSKEYLIPQELILCVEQENRSDFTDEYKHLTKDFYLKF